MGDEIQVPQERRIPNLLLEYRMTQLEEKVTDGFSKANERFDKIDARFEKQEARSMQQLFAIVVMLLGMLGGFATIIVTLLQNRPHP